MGKRKTISIIIFSLVLAALIAAAGVFGTALSRSTYSDSSEAYAGEARWKVTEKTVGEITEESVTVPIEKIRPEYKSYEVHIGRSTENNPTMNWSYRPDDPGIRTYEVFEGTDTSSATPRTSEFFGVVATLQNVGDVKASVTVEDTDGFGFDRDGCLGGDDDRYTDEEVAAHFECELYWSKVGTYETKDAAKVGHLDSTPISLAAGGDDVVYFYAYVKWTTDLEEDMFVTDASGNKTLNENYDGTFGDEFDTWAGEHLLGITFSVRIRAEQAE